jgi:hypothetical protein
VKHEKLGAPNFQ